MSGADPFELAGKAAALRSAALPVLVSEPSSGASSAASPSCTGPLFAGLSRRPNIPVRKQYPVQRNKVRIAAAIRSRRGLRTTRVAGWQH